MHRRFAAAVLGAAALAATPANALTSHLTRTFAPDVTLTFDALALGALGPGVSLAPGVAFDGEYPPFVLGVAATVVDAGGGDRALDLASGQTAGFVFDPPVEAAGVSVEQIIAGTQVTVRALDAAGQVLTAFGYIYQTGLTVRFPEVVDATDMPIATLLVTAQGGAYRVDDLDFVPVPEPAASYGLAMALAALLASGSWRPGRDSNPRPAD